MAEEQFETTLRSRPGLDRQRVDAFIARHLLAWDVCMAVLALLFLGIGFLEDHPAGALNQGTLVPAEDAITLVFLAEFSLRCYVAASRRAYLKAHWIDLLALVPTIRWLRFLRLGRFVRVIQLARVLRLGVLVRFLVELDRVVRGVRRTAMRNGVHVFLIVAASFAVIGGTLVWELERGSNPSFHNFGDAIWWAFATMTTVGYGNGPATLAGRVIAAIVMVVGIGCFGVVTATVTAYFMQQHPGHLDRKQPTPDELMAVLEDIRARLARLEQASAGGAAVEEDLAALTPRRDEQRAIP